LTHKKTLIESQRRLRENNECLANDEEKMCQAYLNAKRDLSIGYGNSSELGAQYLWTHLPVGFFAISSPDLMGALHSEHVVLNFAFI
jgi:hypothetical protein